jgi:hypothetical protein
MGRDAMRIRAAAVIAAVALAGCGSLAPPELVPPRGRTAEGVAADGRFEQSS